MVRRSTHIENMWAMFFGVGGTRVRVPKGARAFSLSSETPKPSLGPTHAPIQWTPGIRRPDREADQ